MSWFFEEQHIATKRNGPLMLRRELGRWSLISPDRTQQSSPYIDAMWRKVFGRLDRKQSGMRVLALGVGLGGNLELISKMFRAPHVVAVDWDRELIEISKKKTIHRWPDSFELLEGDAATIVPTLDRQFDLAIVDLFVAHDVAPCVSDSAFQHALISKIAPGGKIVLNVYDQLAVGDSWKELLPLERTVRYKENTILCFSNP